MSLPQMSEIQKVLQNEITPTLERLRGEKRHYLKWSANNTEVNTRPDIHSWQWMDDLYACIYVLSQIEKLQRLCIAYAFSKANEEVSRSADELKEMEEHRDKYVHLSSRHDWAGGRYRVLTSLP